MKWWYYLILAIALALGIFAYVQYGHAQGPPTQPPQITAQDLENQLSEVGCKAERQAASQTIMQLRQQNADLQKQLAAAKDPPRSGATKK